MQAHRLSVTAERGPQHSGYLERPEGMFKTYNKRYFELRGSELLYFSSAADAPGGATAANGSLQVAGAKLRALEPSAASGRPFAFGLTQSMMASREYVMNAESEQSRIDWLSALVTAGAHAAADEVWSPARGSTITTNAVSAAHDLLAAVERTPPNKRMFLASTHEGWMLKLGGVNKTTFQPRYFCVIGPTLVYFKEPVFAADTPTAIDPRGTIHLAGAILAVETHSLVLYGQAHVFTLTPVLHPKSSLFSTLFGERLKKFVFVCRDAADLHDWVTVLRAKIDGTDRDREAADDSESSDDEAPSNVGSPSTMSNTMQSVSDLTASLSVTDHFGNHSAHGGGASASSTASSSSFTPPNTDLLCHLYRLDSETASGEGNITGGWKRRFCGLSIQSKVLRVWKHKPSQRTGSRPQRIDLTGVTVRVSKQLTCPKTADLGLPVLSLCFPAESGHARSSTWIHLALPTQTKFDNWRTFLQLAVSSPARREDESPELHSTTSESHHATQKPERSKLTSPPTRRTSDMWSSGGHSQPTSPLSSASAPKSRRNGRTSDAGATPATGAADASSATAAPSSASKSPSHSSLLQAMSDALSDPEAMASFRRASVELTRGTLPVPAYFRVYFRTFGKEMGVRFWEDLLAIVPRDEVRTELRELYEQHRHLFDSSADDTQPAAADDTPASDAHNRSASAPHPAFSSTKPSSARSTGARSAKQPDSDDSLSPSEGDDDFDSPETSPAPSSVMPNFGFAPPTKHKQWPPASPHSQTSTQSTTLPAFGAAVAGNQQPTPAKPRPATPLVSPAPTPAPTRAATSAPPSASTSPSPILPAMPAAVPGESESDLRDRVSADVSAWSLRCEHHIVTLLCTLHEVCPGLVAPGAFIPFQEEAPTLKEVHSTYLKALRVLHPDKTKDKPHHIQVLLAVVFQAVQSAYAAYDRAEKKKAKKAAAAAAATSNA